MFNFLFTKTDHVVGIFQWLIDNLHRIADKHEQQAADHADTISELTVARNAALAEVERARTTANKIAGLFS